MADMCDVGRYEQGVWLLRSAVVLVLALWVETVIGRDVKKPKPLPEAELVHMAPARVEPSDANSEAVDEVSPVSDPRRGRALTDMRNAVRAARDDERPRLRTGTPLRKAPPNSTQKLPSRPADTMRRGQTLTRVRPPKNQTSERKMQSGQTLTRASAPPAPTQNFPSRMQSGKSLVRRDTTLTEAANRVAAVPRAKQTAEKAVRHISVPPAQLKGIRYSL